MSRDNLGSRQAFVLHNCSIKNERYDLLITPHRQTKGYIRSKRQTRKKTIITKQKQIIKRRFSKRRNAVSESDTNKIQVLQELKDSINKNEPTDDQLFFFSDSEATTPSSIVGKGKIKKSSINKPIRLYNWNQPIRHIESYILTV